MNQEKVDTGSRHCFLTLASVSAANNEGLELLDLSWNHLRMKGAVAFCAGLKVCAVPGLCFVTDLVYTV